MKVVWSPLALDRVREHASFIERDNPSAARDWVNDLFDAAEALASFPTSGRVVPEVGRADIRELIHDGYRIIYRIETDQVAVLTVRHSRQQLPPDEIDEGE
ncbi:MAG: type II toxin-antitoxin system RelE/ParE family toxin [Persicimonas sp.]